MKRKNDLRQLALLAFALAATLTLALVLGTVSGCGGKNTWITVISREDGSGTRSAFTELLGIARNGVDNTSALAEVSNTTAVVMQSVAGNENAIGYVSLGSLGHGGSAIPLSVVSVDGVAPSEQTIAAGTYPVARPFLLALPPEVDGAAQDFIDFIVSAEGQAIVRQKGFIPGAGASVDSADSGAGVPGAVPAGAKAGSGGSGGDPARISAPDEAAGTIVVAGSTSVAPVMEALADAYKKIHPQVKVEIQQTGSSAGVTSTLEGASHLGMVSRDLSESERASGLESLVIALDGIAVVVHESNPVQNLSVQQIQDIYTGRIQDWSQLGWDGSAQEEGDE